MAEQQTLDTLVIKVVSDTTNAQEGLTKLADTLERIKGVSSGGKGFSNIQKNIDAITASMSKVESGGILKLKYLSQSLKALGEVKISKTIPDRLTAIGEAVDLLKSVDTSKFTEISQGMQTLSSVGNVRISGAGATKGASPAAKDESSWVAMNKRTGEFVADTAATLNKGKAMFADFADKAKTALGNVGLAVLKLNAEMRKFFDAHNLSLRRFGSDIGKFLTAPFRKAQSVVKAFTGKFSNFFAMFKKRAMYRAINGIISAITDGFKTGTDNLYQYSKAISGPFADSMDRIATTLLYFKNSIGAAVGPLINMLAPAIDFCTDKAVEFLNTINQLFARLSGASSWTKAIRYPKEYAEAADDATKANEELKKTILGFDQLNVLQDNSKKDKKSGKQADDYSKMFEEVALTASTSPFEGFFTPFRKAWENEGENTIKAIKKAFGQIKELLETAGKTFNEVWQNGTGQETVETILRIVQNLAGAAGNFAESFSKAWKENDSGLRIVQGVWDIFNDILKTIERITGATSDWFKALDLSPLLNAVAGLVEALEPLFESLGGAITYVYEKVLLPIAKWAIEDVAPRLIGIISEIVKAFTNFFDPVAEGVKKLWDKLQPVAEWIEGGVVFILDKIKEQVEKITKVLHEKGPKIADTISRIGDVLATAWDVAKPIFEYLKDEAGDVLDLLGDIVSDTIGGIIDVLHGLIVFVQGVFTGDWKTAWEGIKEIFGGVWNWQKNITGDFADYYSKRLNKIKEASGNAWGTIKEKASEAWSKIKEKWNNAPDWFKNTIVQPIKNIFSPLFEFYKTLFGNILKTVKDVFHNVEVIAHGCGELFMKLWNYIWNETKLGGMAKSAWEAIKRVFSGAADFFSNIVQNAWQGIVKAFSVGGKIFVTITQGVLEGFKSVVNGLIRGINEVITIPFNGINWALRKIRDISIAGFQPFSGLVEISVPQIPYLAKGGMVPNNGTMFIAGEAGAEVVANIGNRTGVMNTDQMQKSVEQGILNATGSIANAVAAAVAKSGQNGIAPTVEVTVKADSETLYKTVKKGEKYFNNRYHVVVGA